MMATKIQGNRIDELTYERLRDAILDGTYSPGESLVESRLAGEYGVSKTPVREALIRLQRDGLVQMESYRGARVTQLTPDDVRAICDVRRALESHIARELAMRGREPVLRKLQRNIEGSATAYEAGDNATLLGLIPLFTDIIADGHGNPWMIRILNGLRSLLGLIGSASLHEPDRIKRSLDQHRGIYDAIATGDPDGAAAAVHAHIESVEADCLSHLETRSN
jgi:DNA-binding GntR family transcriptional regulator